VCLPAEMHMGGERGPFQLAGSPPVCLEAVLSADPQLPGWQRGEPRHELDLPPLRGFGTSRRL